MDCSIRNYKKASCINVNGIYGNHKTESVPASHISCINILALTVKGVRNPNGSKNVAILLGILLDWILDQ